MSFVSRSLPPEPDFEPFMPTFVSASERRLANEAASELPPVEAPDLTGWKVVRHPFKIVLRGWCYSDEGAFLISSHGTVFAFRAVPHGKRTVLYARRHEEAFQ